MILIYKNHWLILSVLLLTIILTYHEADSSPVLEIPLNIPQYQIAEGLPVLSAKAFGIYDLESGEMLVSYNADATLPIASVTKIVTAAVLISKYDLEETKKVLSSDLLAEGRAGNLQVGDEYSLRDLIFPLLLESSNDAAEFYYRATDGFVVSEMNNLASKLQLTKTKFVDGSGLSSSNTSSIVDLQNLMRYVHQETPFVLDVSRLRNYIGPNKAWTNNSPIWHQDYRGGKHGYTIAANRTALALFSEKFAAGERQLIYVLLGSDNLAVEMDKLRSFVKTRVTFK